MHGFGEPAEQICRQGDSDPVSALFPVGVQLFLSALAGPLPDPAHLQVGQGCLGAGTVVALSSGACSWPLCQYLCQSQALEVSWLSYLLCS